MTNYIGVDPAAARLDAVVLYSDDTWKLEKRTMPTDMVERCVAADRWMYRLVTEARALGERVVVGIELPVLGRPGRAGANGTLPNATVQGALIAGARRAGAVVLLINNKTWKSKIVGNGNASKPEINKFIRKTWPALWRAADGRQDSCDAACIVQDTQRKDRLLRKMAATRRRAEALKSGDVFAGLPKRRLAKR